MKVNFINSTEVLTKAVITDQELSTTKIMLFNLAYYQKKISTCKYIKVVGDIIKLFYLSQGIEHEIKV